MQKYIVRYLETAAEDFVSLIDYVGRYSVEAAGKIAGNIMEAADSLETMPKKYPAYEAQPVFRKMVVQDVLVFYVVYEELCRVDIHRIIHGKRNLV